MKKVLSFVLVLAMILGSFSMVFAASVAPDVVDTKYESAVASLSNLDVINGYPDGTFQPEKNVTRAEFCKIVIKAMGVNLDGAKSWTAFTDVPSDFWASGYINQAYGLGIVKGRTATTFDPNAKVTYNEAIAMVVRALGYQDERLVGSYPASHISKASGLLILNGVPTGVASATRGDIAQLVYNTLDVYLVQYQGDNGAETRLTDTMLSRILGVKAGSTGNIVLFGQKADEVVKNVKNVKSYLGAYGSFYRTEEEAGGELVAVKEVKSTYLTGTFSKDGKTFKSNGVTYSVESGAYSFKVNDEATNTEKTTSPASFNNGEYVGKIENITSGSVDNPKTYKIAAKVAGKKLTKVYSAQLWENPNTFRFSTQLNEAKLMLAGSKFREADEGGIDYDEFELVGVDSLKDIQKDNVVYVYTRPSDKTISKVEVGTKTVEGKIVRIGSNEERTIGDATYPVSQYKKAKFEVGNEGTFYLDVDGKLYDWEPTKGQDLYGVLLAVQNKASNPFDGKDCKAQIVTAEGKKTIFTVKDGVAEKAVTQGKWAANITDGVNALKTGVGVAYRVDDNGLITSIKTMASIESPSAMRTFGGNQVDVTKYGVILGQSTRFNSDSVVFLEDKDGKWSAIKPESVYGAKDLRIAAHVNSNGNVVFATVDGLTTKATNYVVLTGWAEVDDGSDYSWKIKTFNNGVYKEEYSDEGVSNYAKKVMTSAALVYELTFSGEKVVTVSAITTAAASDGQYMTVTAGATTDGAVYGQKVVTVKNEKNANADKDFAVAETAYTYVLNGNDVWEIAEGGVDEIVASVENGDTLHFFDYEAGDGYKIVVLEKK